MKRITFFQLESPEAYSPITEKVKKGTFLQLFNREINPDTLASQAAYLRSKLRHNVASEIPFSFTVTG